MERDHIVQGTPLKQYGPPFVAGSLAGLVATVPMTLFMFAVQNLLPQWQQYALPPERLTDTIASHIGIRKHMDKPQLLLASFVSHFGFGAAMGAIYGPLAKAIPLPSSLKGTIFGIVVWLAAYRGWLPVIGMSEAATRQPIERNMLMIAAHLVWGAGTGKATNLLEGVVSRLLRG